MLLAGQLFRAGPGVTTAIPAIDFETRSAAGYGVETIPGFWRPRKNREPAWIEPRQKLCSLPGAAETNRGLDVVGRRCYMEHPTFSVLSLAYDLLDGNGARLWTPARGEPTDMLNYVAAGGAVSAWNAGFEFDAWNIHMCARYRWPALRLEQLHCDAAKARASGYPGKLETAGSVMRLAEQKDKAGTDLLKLFSMPHAPTKKHPHWWVLPEQRPADFERLLAYNGQDVRAELAASLHCPDLPADERDVWLTDQRVNNRGLGVDTAGVEDCIAVVEQVFTHYEAELRTITAGAVQYGSEVQKITAWLAARGVYVDGLKEEVVEEALARPNLPPEAARVLRIRQILASAAIKKLYALRHQTASDGRVHDLYVYHGARTGRWTGGGPQPQNFPKGVWDESEFDQVLRALEVMRARSMAALAEAFPDHDPFDVIASCLRSLLIAGPDHELVCSDFSAIEGVVAAAVAGEDWRIEVFRTHGMIYEASAAKICKLPFSDFVEHKAKTKKHHPMRQKIGKPGELGSGFGGWIGAWKNFGADEFLTDEEIKQGILAWREASPNIVEMWGGQTRGRFRDARPELFGLEGAVVSALQNPGKAYHYRAIAYEYQADSDALYCRLPSGRLLTYHAPRLEYAPRFDWSPPWEVQISFEGWNTNPKMGPLGWQRMSTYGGKLFENVVQAVARDLQANAMVQLERRAYPVVLHSHDEIASEVRRSAGSVAEFEHIVNTTLPAWAVMPDGSPWPIKMKGGWRGDRYRKA